MTDPQLLVRIDALIAVLALALVVGCFALMALDTVVGVLALATVVLTGGVGLRSYYRARQPIAAE